MPMRVKVWDTPLNVDGLAHCHGAYWVGDLLSLNPIAQVLPLVSRCNKTEYRKLARRALTLIPVDAVVMTVTQTECPYYLAYFKNDMDLFKMLVKRFGEEAVREKCYGT